MTYVAQPEPMGCGIACLAMMLNRSYDSICAEYGRRFVEKGTNSYAIIEFMAKHGYASVTKYRYSQLKGDVTPGEEGCRVPIWPVLPFAPIHVCEVRQPSNHYHFVLMLQDGKILDPLRLGTFSFGDWPEILGIYGFYKISQAQ